MEAIMSMPATSFDLAAQVDSLKREETWQRSDRVARTLVQRPGFHLVLTVIKLGAALREHRAEGHVTVQTVAGHLRLHVGAQSVDLPAGHLLALEPGVPHDVEALEESAFLLTVATP